MFRSHVMVCGGTGCTSSGSDKIAKAFEDEILATGLENEVKVIRTGCFGLCALGPIVVIYPEGSFYSMVKEEDVKEIVDEHLLKGRPVTRLLYDETVAEDNTVKSLDDTAFYKKQMRIALRNCGVINPENIDEYIAFDGYQALGKVLTEMTPDDVIQTILDSGLRGRGGADELKVQRALGREQICPQRDGARDIVRALVHAGVEDALGRDAELFADRQLARGADLHPAEHVRQAAQHEGVGLHGVAQIYIRAERGAHPLSARREGLQIKQIQRRAVFRGRRPECSLVHQSSSCRRCTMASRLLAELKFSGTRSFAPISMSNASLSAATSDTMSNDSRMWSSMRAVSVSKSMPGQISLRISMICFFMGKPSFQSSRSTTEVHPSGRKSFFS